MELGLDLEGRNPICRATLGRKFGGNSIPGVKGYIKTVDAGISEISIVIGSHVNKVYARLNKVFDEIKGASKRAKNWPIVK